MKTPFLPIFTFFALLGVKSWAQVTITNDDFFSEPGDYYRSHVGRDVPSATLIGEKGGPHRWDFSEGPEEEVFRFDYLDPRNTIIGAEFPDATIAEKKLEEKTGSEAWLLYDLVDGVGRRVFGFWELENFIQNASKVFDNPVVDFPAQMNFGDSWATSVTYSDSLAVFGFDVPAQFTHSSEFEVDGWGFIDLPGLGLGDCLRINELEQVSVALDIDGSGILTNAAQEYVRNYYWIRPGYGIVAQMASTIPSPNPPGDNYPVASVFLRMFETNRDPSGGCAGPESVDDLILERLDQNRVLLSWSEAECTRQYRVEVNSVGLHGDHWEVVETTTNTLYLDTSAASSESRFYRVISLP